MTANTPLVEYLNVAWRRKWQVIMPAVIGLGIATGIYFLLPKVYSAQATVVPNQAQVSKELARPIVSPYLQMKAAQLNETVKSKDTLELIFAKLKNLKPGEEVDSDAAAALKDAFTLDAAQGKIQFKVRDRDPQYAADLATAAAGIFVETAGKDRNQWSGKVTSYMEKEASDAQKALEAKENDIKTFRDANFGYLPEDANAATLAIANMHNELTRTQADITARVESRTREDYLDVDEVNPKDLPDPQTGERPSQTLTRMQGELNSLLLTRTERHPDVILKKQQLADIVKRLQIQPAGEGPVLDMGSIELVGPVPPPQAVRRKVDENERQILQLQAYEKKLQEDISAAEEKLQRARSVEPVLMAMNREKSELEGLYKSANAEKNKVDTNRGIFFDLIPDQFQMGEPAKVPVLPVSPILWLVLVIGAGAGLAIGLVIVVLLTLLDQSYRYAEEIQAHFDVPVIASITRILAPDEAAKRVKQRKGKPVQAAAV